jgi:hypothetical protein
MIDKEGCLGRRIANVMLPETLQSEEKTFQPIVIQIVNLISDTEIFLSCTVSSGLKFIYLTYSNLFIYSTCFYSLFNTLYTYHNVNVFIINENTVGISNKYTNKTYICLVQRWFLLPPDCPVTSIKLFSVVYEQHWTYEVYDVYTLDSPYSMQPMISRIILALTL